MAGWRSAERLVATDPWQFRVYRKPGGGCFDVVTDLVNGCIVEKSAGNLPAIITKVRLPDGREGYAKAESLTPVKDWAAQQFDPQLILAVASSMEGTPYLWGGTSTKALDCSGLAKVSYLANGSNTDARRLAAGCDRNADRGQNWRDCRKTGMLGALFAASPIYIAVGSRQRHTSRQPSGASGTFVPSL